MTTQSVLVLDSTPEASAVIAEGLAAEGMQTTVCESIPTLLSHVNMRAPAVCVIGARLKEGDGISLVRELFLSSTSGLIVLGDRNDELDTVLALELGADDFVVKPVRRREIAARVRAVMRRTLRTGITDSGAVRAMPEEYLKKIGDLEICGILRSVTRAGKEIRLTTREFDVLMVLVSRVNAICSRSEIVQLLNGPATAFNDRLIDGIISRLRRKLFDTGSEGMTIKTVHGLGYTLTHGTDRADGPERRF